MTRIRIAALPLLALPLLSASSPATAEIVMKPITCPYADTGFAIVGAKGERDGVAAEYRWLAVNRAGWKRDKQLLMHKDGHDYDVLEISREAEHDRICFDITAFFGHF